MTFTANQIPSKCPNKKMTTLKHSSSMKEDINISKSYTPSAFSVGKCGDNVDLNLKINILIKVLNSARTTCDEKIKEHFDIVWYAMNRCRNPNHDASRRIENTAEYGEKLAELRGNDCDFYHGFNSGVLAIARMCKEQLSFKFEESFIWSKDHSSLSMRKNAVDSVRKFPDLSLVDFPTSNQVFTIPNLKLSVQEKEICLKIWSKFITDSLTSVKETVSEKEKEAYDLVWFIQFRCRYPKHDDSERIERDYKEKIEQLRGNEGEFFYGFHSGVLAFSRLLLSVTQIPEGITSIEPFRMESVTSEYSRHVEKVKMAFPDKSVSDCPSNRN